MTLPPLRLFLIAGEPSGDRLGGALMEALAAERPGTVFAGIVFFQEFRRGGERLAGIDQPHGSGGRLNGQAPGARLAAVVGPLVQVEGLFGDGMADKTGTGEPPLGERKVMRGGKAAVHLWTLTIRPWAGTRQVLGQQRINAECKRALAMIFHAHVHLTEGRAAHQDLGRAVEQGKGRLPPAVDDVESRAINHPLVAGCERIGTHFDTARGASFCGRAAGSQSADGNGAEGW
ncbi:MAG: hypothetical protein AAFV49_14835 [Pseudomonadota bacterium]